MQFNIDYLKPLYGELAIDGLENIKVSFKDGKTSFKDVGVELKESKYGVDLLLTAKESLISHLYLFYEFKHERDLKVFGDSLERGYADMAWRNIDEPRQMFWYFFVNDQKKKELSSYGVCVQPNTIVSFRIIDNFLRVDINTQSGGSGVNLEGRVLKATTFVQKEAKYDSLFASCRDFVKLLMGDVKKVELKEPVYGFNNWYYAYGDSSFEQILADTKLLQEVTKDISVRPFMVIDDGWQLNHCAGPWVPNPLYKDMKVLASEIKKLGIKPGLWFRPLYEASYISRGHNHPYNLLFLDPTDEFTLNRISDDIKRFVDWGFELIKFDYVTYDMFYRYAYQMDDNLTDQGWRYKDNHFTNAEIILKLYRTIREAAGDKAILIGCDTFSHLCAGITELNRTGDDISGRDWDRTVRYGVNSLAFRIMQNDIFYKIDGDCVGHMGLIDWKKNREWLYALAYSNSPLFISCDPTKATPEIKEDLNKALKINLEHHTLEPINWVENPLPNEWLIDGHKVEFDWNKNK